MQWLRTDLNQLKVLHAVLTGGSVTAAARTLNLTPSAVSHRLRRLREDLGDPLFARVGQGMEPTPRVLELAGPLSAIISALSESEMGREEDFRQMRRTLRVAMPATLEISLLPGLYQELSQLAPHVDLVVTPFERRSYDRELTQGLLDFVVSVGGGGSLTREVRREPLYADHLVSVVGPLSPLYEDAEFEMDAWLEESHVYHAPWPVSENHLDQWLARNRRPRKIAMVLSHHGAVGHLVRRSRLVATVPTKMANVLTATWPELRVMTLPQEIAVGEVCLEFAAAFAQQPFMTLVRQLIHQVVDPAAPKDLATPSQIRALEIAS
jgi:DNA-binding transcriptional LysR family regulator